jgi:endonuclease/exonuclease/phosphatase (EEP) superfamily protein YafD
MIERVKMKIFRDQRLRLIAGIWLGATGLVVAAMTFAGLAGGVWWPLDLAVHFQAQYALALALCVVGLLAVGYRRAAALLAVPLAINLVLIAPLYVAPQGTGRGSAIAAADSLERPLDLLQFNVQMNNHRYADVAAYIDAGGAEIVAVQETDQAWLDALVRGAPRYRVAAAAPQPDKHGLALLVLRDRPGLEVDARVLDLTPGRWSTPAIEADVVRDGRRLALLTLHPRTPLHPLAPEQRNAQLAATERWAQDHADPVIVLGDLNATPWSAPFRQLVAATGLVNSQRGFGLELSWPAPLPLPMRLPIDHCLHSPELVALERRLGPALGSDHRALHVRLGWADDGG